MMRIMIQSFLNGRIKITSLAAPTEEDKRVLAALSDADRQLVIAEALERAEASGAGDRTPEEIWEAAKARAADMAAKNAV